MICVGGNGLKSHMAREKAQAKAAAEGVGGGGKAGIKARTESQVGTTCKICRTNFTSIKMKQQLKDHQTAKHPKSTLADCFPDCHTQLV